MGKAGKGSRPTGAKAPAPAKQHEWSGFIFFTIVKYIHIPVICDELFHKFLDRCEQSACVWWVVRMVQAVTTVTGTFPPGSFHPGRFPP